jgi:hypothetical protein
MDVGIAIQRFLICSSLTAGTLPSSTPPDIRHVTLRTAWPIQQAASRVPAHRVAAGSNAFAVTLSMEGDIGTFAPGPSHESGGKSDNGQRRGMWVL